MGLVMWKPARTMFTAFSTTRKSPIRCNSFQPPHFRAVACVAIQPTRCRCRAAATPGRKPRGMNVPTLTASCTLSQLGYSYCPENELAIPSMDLHHEIIARIRAAKTSDKSARLSDFQFRAYENCSALVNIKTGNAEFIYDEETVLHDLDDLFSGSDARTRNRTTHPQSWWSALASLARLAS